MLSLQNTTLSNKRGGYRWELWSYPRDNWPQSLAPSYVFPYFLERAQMVQVSFFGVARSPSITRAPWEKGWSARGTHAPAHLYNDWSSASALPQLKHGGLFWYTLRWDFVQKLHFNFRPIKSKLGKSYWSKSPRVKVFHMDTHHTCSAHAFIFSHIYTCQVGCTSTFVYTRTHAHTCMCTCTFSTCKYTPMHVYMHTQARASTHTRAHRHTFMHIHTHVSTFLHSHI